MSLTLLTLGTDPNQKFQTILILLPQRLDIHYTCTHAHRPYSQALIHTIFNNPSFAKCSQQFFCCCPAPTAWRLLFVLSFRFAFALYLQCLFIQLVSVQQCRRSEMTTRVVIRARATFISQTATTNTNNKLEALRQCIPPPRHVLPVTRSVYGSGDPDRHQSLTICSLAHCQPFSENFMQIRSEVFAQS